MREHAPNPAPHLDWLTVRYDQVPASFPSDHSDKQWTYRRGAIHRIRGSQPVRIGHLAERYKGMHLTLNGEAFEFPDAKPVAERIHHWLRTFLPPNTSATVCRLDVAQDFPEGGTAHETLAELGSQIAGAWPTRPRYGLDVGWHSRATGQTFEVFPRGRATDDNARRRTPYVRIYNRYGYPRVEIELKHLDRQPDLQEQLATTHATAVVMLAQLGATTPHQPLAELRFPSATRPANADETAARIIGTTLGYASRNRIILDNRAIDALRIIRSALGADGGTHNEELTSYVTARDAFSLSIKE